MIPKSVLDAGRKEREHLTIGKMNTHVGMMDHCVQGEQGNAFQAGSLRQCQNFIEDRVFRAMLRALADEYGVIGAVATETKLLEILGKDQT